jgi:hypothetical protein
MCHPDRSTAKWRELRFALRYSKTNFVLRVLYDCARHTAEW